jgi:hypothetical protein
LRGWKRIRYDFVTPVKVDLSRCSIVFLGAWNQAIFQPDWVSKRVLEGKAPGLEVLFGDAGLLMRFETATASLLVGGTQVMLSPHALDDATLLATEAIAATLLQLLPETPVRAFGINFGYWLDAKGRSADELERLDQGRGGTAEWPRVNRIHRVGTVDRADGAVLNITLGRLGPSALGLDLNEHHPCPSGKAEGALVQLKDRVVGAHDRAKAMARLLYDEEEET